MAHGSIGIEFSSSSNEGVDQRSLQSAAFRTQCDAMCKVVVPICSDEGAPGSVPIHCTSSRDVIRQVHGRLRPSINPVVVAASFTANSVQRAKIWPVNKGKNHLTNTPPGGSNLDLAHRVESWAGSESDEAHQQDSLSFALDVTLSPMPGTKEVGFGGPLSSLN